MSKTTTFPLAEVFGPTIQGEGPDAGRPTHFVRLGGCDYRCSWCDSMHAVDPAQVRKLPRVTAGAIAAEVEKLARGPSMVVISGGNPALHDCGELVRLLQGAGYAVSVETQGSRWAEWLADVDRLVVSPKPPSSGMVSDKHASEFARFMECATVPLGLSVALKVVVFDEDDYRWARQVHERYEWVPFHLSVGTPVDHEGAITDDMAIRSVLARYRWLCERVAGDALMSEARVLPQLHVLAWGQALGV